MLTFPLLNLFSMHSGEQFRHDMLNAGKALHTQSLKLIPIETRLNMVEKQLQEQIVVDVFRGEKTHANMLANELVAIRRVSKLVSDLKVIFETLIVRMATLHDYNEFHSSISSAVGSLKVIKSDLKEVTPAAKQVFAVLSESVSDISTYDIKPSPNVTNVTDDALVILEEASTIVEGGLKRKFPTLPEIKPEKRVLVNA